jgi:iron complex transport system substrate-binding protein
LLALADPGQILSFPPSPRTRPFVSAESARTFRNGAGNAESVVGLAPALVLAGRFTRLATREMLARLGYRLVLLDTARTVDASIAQIREVAALVGHPERGDALIAEIEAARRDAVAAASGQPQSVAFYQRRGYVTGGDTLTSDLLRMVGLTNTGGALAGKAGGFVPLEKLVAEAPNYIVVSNNAGITEDQGSALLAHPAHAARYPPDRRIVLPDRLTVCAGPSLPEALRYLGTAARRLSH